MKRLIFLSLIYLVPFTHLLAQSATDIIKRMDEKMRGDHNTQKVTMVIVRPTWERSISMTSWARGQEYSMILITAPAREAGQAFLKRGNEMWNWVPSIDRMIKIPPSMMMQSWMGSDFTNDDLVRESSIVHDYTHSLEGEETIQGMRCHRILLTPKPEAPVVWGKVLIWVTREDYLQLKAAFYDEDDSLVNTMILSDIQAMSGRRLPTHWEMIPADKEGHSTILELESIDFQTLIPESFFSQQNMKRLRP